MIALQVAEPVCPRCGAPEMHPDGTKLLVRGFKVHDGKCWWSQCLVCAGYYDAELNETPANYDAKKGWYAER